MVYSKTENALDNADAFLVTDPANVTGLRRLPRPNRRAPIWACDQRKRPSSIEWNPGLGGADDDFVAGKVYFLPIRFLYHIPYIGKWPKTESPLRAGGPNRNANRPTESRTPRSYRAP